MTIPSDKLREMLAAATPGPWQWGGHPSDLKLQTVYHGKRYVMAFCRKGMNGAQPMFQPAGRGMVKADRLLQFHVGDQSIVGEEAARSDGSVYRYDVRGVDAPDARLIALAPDLAAEVLRLREMIRRADQVIVWEAYGLGNDFAEQIEAAALEGSE